MQGSSLKLAAKLNSLSPPAQNKRNPYELFIFRGKSLTLTVLEERDAYQKNTCFISIMGTKEKADYSGTNVTYSHRKKDYLPKKNTNYKTSEINFRKKLESNNKKHMFLFKKKPLFFSPKKDFWVERKVTMPPPPRLPRSRGFRQVHLAAPEKMGMKRSCWMRFISCFFWNICAKPFWFLLLVVKL